MAENFKKLTEELGQIMLYENLDEYLFNEAAKFYEILDDPDSTYEEKHAAGLYVDWLVKYVKDFPDYTGSISKGRK